jgi:hypothetical protein
MSDLPELLVPEPPTPLSQALWRLMPKYGDVIARFREDTYARDKERIERLASACQQDVPLECLLLSMQENERLADMFRAAVDSAVRTGDDDKLKLMGRALSDGTLAEDDAAVDEAEQLLRTAVELDPVDLRALLALRRRGTSRPWKTLCEECGLTDVTADVVMARLQRLGLLEVERDAEVTFPDDPSDGQVDVNESYSLTRAAGAVIAALTRKARKAG